MKSNILQFQEKQLKNLDKMKITANEIKPGMIIEHKNEIWNVLKTQHVKPGKGGAFNQVELKSVIKGTKLNERFRSNETVEKAEVEEKNLTFYILMKMTAILWTIFLLSKFLCQKIWLRRNLNWFKENLEVVISLLDEKPISIELPKNIGNV